MNNQEFKQQLICSAVANPKICDSFLSSFIRGDVRIAIEYANAIISELEKEKSFRG